MTKTPRLLVEYPYVLVRFGCSICHRRGQARLARLAEKHGADITLEDLLDRVAYTCPYPRLRRPRKYQVGCGINLPDIEDRSPSPPDLPGSPIKLIVNNDTGEAA